MLTSLILAASLCGQCEGGVCKAPVRERVVQRVVHRETTVGPVRRFFHRERFLLVRRQLRHAGREGSGL